MLQGCKMKFLRLPIQYVLRRKSRNLGYRLFSACHTQTNKNQKVKIPSARLLCTSVDSSDSGISEILSEFENQVNVADQEDEQSYLRIQLYPGESDVYLTRLFEATSIQRVFDLVQEIEQKGEETLTLKHLSQALVTLWDLQKLMFKLGPLFDPSKEFIHREQFINEIRSHEVFKTKILQNIIDNCEHLEDEPLAASLLCLKRMQYDVRSPESEKLVDECIKRKDTITLPAVSRVFVSMRSESLYGYFVQANFVPILMSHCESMSNDLQARLVSISIRNGNRVLSTKIVELYREKIAKLVDAIEMETVTLCKILLSLVDTKTVGEDPSELMRKVGNKLATRVPQMMLLDLLSLQRFIESGSQEPFPLMEALISRISRLIEENHPLRLDLLSCIAPFKKNVYHHQQVFEILQEYINTYEDFEPIVYMLYKILRMVRFSDRSLYDNYWNKVLNLVTFESGNTKKVIRFATDYTNFVQVLGSSYHYAQLENKVKKILYFYFDNYFSSMQPSFLTPSDFAKAFSFLVAFVNPQGDDVIFRKGEYIDKLDELAPQLKMFDIVLIGRSVEVSLHTATQNKASSKYYDNILQICSILEEQVSSRLLHRPGELNTLDLIACARTQTYIRRATRDSPIFKAAIDLIVKKELTDSRVAKDMTSCLLASGGYNEPKAYERLADFIEKVKFDINPEVAEKFVVFAFINGMDREEEKYLRVFDICAKVIHRHMDKLSPIGVLQSSLALCHYRCLPRELVNDIFSVEFIDEIDRGLKMTFGAAAAQLKVRQAFMELNRAVCIDMPNTNVPWFHKKFCEEVISITPIKDDYICKEVCELLGDIFTDPELVQKNVYSPYYYLLDYVIEFDEENRPIKYPKKKASFFSFQKQKSPVVVQDKVAVLILPGAAYTTNVRSLKGHHRLRERHLEILGYRIVSIDPQKWNSMYMAEPSVKSDFLESQIFRKPNYDKDSKVNKSND